MIVNASTIIGLPQRELNIPELINHEQLQILQPI